MISPSSIDIREVVQIGDAFRGLSELPDEVKRQAQAALNDLQNGRKPENVEYKDLGNSLAGISEIKIRFNKDAFRIYNVVIYREVLYLLDAGIKKSKKGGEIPQEDVRRLEMRLKAAKQDYRLNRSTYETEYVEREERRIARQERLEKQSLAIPRKPKVK